MTTEDICNLPVQDICEDNCVLFLWVTNPLLPEGLRVIESWGFKYITVGFVWYKQYKNGNKYCGMGHYTRPSIEMCLLAKKGNLKRVSKGVYQCHEAVLTRHSEKPHLFRDKIVELFGDLPRIELFARHKIDGWDYWGNQLVK